MGKTGEQREVQDHLKGMASHILSEVIRADMSMHHAQIEAWQWFSKHLPKGELINDDLSDGLPRNMYLAVNDLSITFQVKPNPLGLWKRFVLALKILVRRGPTFINYPNTFVISSPSDPQALKVSINVRRFKNGTVKASYGPADEETAELLKKKSPMNLSLLKNVFAKYLPEDFPNDLDVMENKFMTQPGESLIEASNRMGVFDLGELKNLNKTFNKKDQSTPQVVKTAGEPEKLSPDVKAIINALETLQYKVRKEDSKNYNLNIVGIRNEEVKLNQFNDELWVFWKFDSLWKLNKYKITTNPGLFWLNHPMNPEGTAIVKEGQYPNSHIFGKHRGKYDALVQANPMTVIRDANKDNKLDYDSGKTQTGLFGINVHRASETQETKYVDKYSAGCQVFANPTQFNEFIKLCKLYMAEWGNGFTYTLIRKGQIKM